MHISAAHTIQLYHLYKEYLTTTSVTSKVEDFMNQKTCIKFIYRIIDFDDLTKLDYLTGDDIEKLGGRADEYTEFYNLCVRVNKRIIDYYKISSDYDFCFSVVKKIPIAKPYHRTYTNSIRKRKPTTNTVLESSLTGIKTVAG